MQEREEKALVGKKKMQNLLTTAGLVRDCSLSGRNREMHCQAPRQSHLIEWPPTRASQRTIPPREIRRNFSPDSAPLSRVPVFDGRCFWSCAGNHCNSAPRCRRRRLRKLFTLLRSEGVSRRTSGLSGVGPPPELRMIQVLASFCLSGCLGSLP